MVNVAELEENNFGGQVQILFTRCVTELKNDARELEVLCEEIRVVIARTARYLSRPISVRSDDVHEEENRNRSRGLISLPAQRS